MTLGDVEIDARLISTPSMSWLHSWTMHQSQLSFSRAGGQTYEVYTKHLLSELYLRTDLFSVYFEGYIKLDYWTDIAESLQRAWNSTSTFSGNQVYYRTCSSSKIKFVSLKCTIFIVSVKLILSMICIRMSAGKAFFYFNEQYIYYRLHLFYL